MTRKAFTAANGTRFIFNSDMTGSVTIILPNFSETMMMVSADDLREFMEQVELKPQRPASASGRETAGER